MSELKLQQCRVDGRYDVLDCLGRGSYSEVYVARDVAAADGAPAMIVLKALNTYLQGAPDPELEQTLIDNFRNEAVALDRVRHPNVINRLGHGTAIDLTGRVFHYLVLEYLPGGDLNALCRRRPLKLEGALFYLEQVCSGMEHAHSRGVIHRDIKPQNLLLTADQHTVKIADFGVAKLGATDGAITRVGTDVYAAPEHHPLMQTGQLDTASLTMGALHLTPAADIYSLAKTAYALLVGEPPRRFSQRPITELPAKFMAEPWGWEVARVLERATQSRPEKRYQAVGDFWADLREASLPHTRLLGQSNGPVFAPEAEGLNEEDADGTGGTPPPPPAPVFTEKTGPAPAVADRSKDSQHFRIVVPISTASATREAAPPARRQPAEPPARRREEASAHASLRPEPASTHPRRRGLSDRAKKWLVALFLIAAFAGMLLATYFYFRREPRASQTPTAPGAQAGRESPVGREFVATNDVNLRGQPNGQLVGKVPNGSVVKVQAVNGGWYQIQILQYKRPKERASDADQGWADKDFFTERQ
ncbi:MAG TPA: serine/threonine protein kinase [Pyrinomonadaceae bacterium]